MSKPTPLYEDNQGAIALSVNNQFHTRSKHIDIKYHYVREQVERGDCIFYYTPTTEQAADGLTKPLGKIMFQRFIKQLRLVVPTV